MKSVIIKRSVNTNVFTQRRREIREKNSFAALRLCVRCVHTTIDQYISTMKRLGTVFLLLIVLLALMPGAVQAAPIQTEDPALVLLDQEQAGVNYDPENKSWFFYGVPVEYVRYEMPGVSVDLMRILFRSQEGGYKQVWVAAGMDILSRPTYLSRGEWSTVEQRNQSVRLRETLLRIYVSETEGVLHPQIDPEGIRWDNCVSGNVCEYGELFDTVHNDLSNRFIVSEDAPGWYPWGFLYWDVEIVNRASHTMADPTAFGSVPK